MPIGAKVFQQCRKICLFRYTPIARCLLDIASILLRVEVHGWGRAEAFLSGERLLLHGIEIDRQGRVRSVCWDIWRSKIGLACDSTIILLCREARGASRFTAILPI